MSDILSSYYNTYFSKNHSINETINLLTPDRIIINKPDLTARNLSPYGIYLSEKNFLLIKRKKTLIPSALNIKKKFNFDKFIENLEKESLKKVINDNSEKEKEKKENKDKEDEQPQLKKCLSYRKKNYFEIYNIHNLSNKNKNRNGNNYNEENEFKTLPINNNIDRITNGGKIQKSRNDISELFALKSSLNNNGSSINDNFRTTASMYMKNSPICQEYNEHKTFYKSTKNTKNLKILQKEVKRKKINNKLEADKITKELLSLKTKKEIKGYYIKKDYAKAIAQAEKSSSNNNVNKSIDPMTYIKFNLANDPHNNNLFRSFNTQLMIMGNQKYRNELLDGVNMYKKKIIENDD